MKEWLKAHVESRRLTIEQVKDRVHSVHGDIVSLDESTYINTAIKARFNDKDYGEWWATPNNVLRGSVCKKRYNKRTSERMKIPLEDFKNRLFKVWGSVVAVIESTYQGTNIQCKFLDKDYGEFYVYPYFVLAGGGHVKRGRERAKITCMQKYGVDNVSKSKEILKKISKKVNNPYTKNHWKTNEILDCQGSYEFKVIDWLNHNKIDYKWQLTHFDPFLMPNNKTYLPDLCLVNENKWIEIKGRFYKDAQEKWNWFHKEYPNSELWDYKKLRQMEIL